MRVSAVEVSGDVIGVAGWFASFGGFSDTVFVAAMAVNGGGEVLWDSVRDEDGDCTFGEGLVRMSDGGWLVVGELRPICDVAGSVPLARRLLASGEPSWETLGFVDSFSGSAADVIELAGGFALATGSVDGGALLWKLGPTGETVWEKTFGASRDHGSAIAGDGAGGAIVVGRGAGRPYAWIVDSAGVIVRETSYADGSAGWLTDVAPVDGGGFVLAGGSEGDHARGSLLFINAAGELLRESTFGSEVPVFARAVAVDRESIVVGGWDRGHDAGYLGFFASTGRLLGEVVASGMFPIWDLSFGSAGQLAVGGAAGRVGFVRVLSDEPFGIRRGDIDGNRRAEFIDALSLANHLFFGRTAPACADAADVTDDGVVEMSDVVYLLNYLFLDGPPPPEPFSRIGSDPTDDGLRTCVCD